MGKKSSIYIFVALAACALIATIVLMGKKQGGITLADKVIDKGTCSTTVKNAGRKLLEPLHPNNTPLSFETGPDCNIIGRLKHESIILYKSPRGPDPITVKIAGMPGDSVKISSNNMLLINDADFKNSAGGTYRIGARDQRAQINTIKDAHQGIIPEGHYFVMGDNDRVYLDSSRFGLAKAEDILGILQE